MPIMPAYRLLYSLYSIRRAWVWSWLVGSVNVESTTSILSGCLVSEAFETESVSCSMGEEAGRRVT